MLRIFLLCCLVGVVERVVVGYGVGCVEEPRPRWSSPLALLEVRGYLTMLRQRQRIKKELLEKKQITL